MFYLWSIRNFNNLVMLTCQVMLCRYEVNNLKRTYIYDGNEDNRLETIRIWRIKIQKLGIKRFISKG